MSHRLYGDVWTRCSRSEGGSAVEIMLSLRHDTSGSGPCSFPDSVNLTAAVVQDQRPFRVGVMSAAAPGTSKAAHGDVAAKKKKGPGALATAYLVIYNVVMTAGYVACSLVLMLLCWSVCVFVCDCVCVCVFSWANQDWIAGSDI